MKQEVRRGRKFVEYHDPDTQDEHTFTQEISGADVSYQDEQGRWLATDENWAADGLDGYLFKNDKLNHKVRLKGAGGRRWYPRRNIESEYLTFGIPQLWDGKRWKNFGFNGYSVEGKTITLNTNNGVTILIHSRWNGIKIDWVLASSSAPTRMRYPVALTGITEIAGVLFGADGVELGRLSPTTATDSTFDEMGEPTQLPCTGSYVNGYVEFQADVTGAVYPVTIDPDFAGGSSFGYVSSSNANYAIARSTSANINTTALFVGQRKAGNYYLFRSYLQFDTSSIPDTDIVTQVNLRMVSDYNGSTSDEYDIQIVKYNWSGQDPITNDNREAAYDGCLAAEADDSIWRNTDGMSINTQYTSGNLSTAWINKTGVTYYGLRSSRDVSATPPTGDEYGRICNPTNATESYRPVLTVTYTTAAAGNPHYYYAQL